ncbi:MAG: Ig-like domain-containing protein [Pseudomonadota bacterium]
MLIEKDTAITLAAILATLAWTSAIANDAISYDVLGRVVKVTETATGKSICYGYDGAGNRTNVRVATGACNGAPVFVADATVSMHISQYGKNVYPLQNDTDPDNDPLKLLNVSAPAGLTITVHTNNEGFLVQPNSKGTHTVTYSISDGFGGVSAATLTVYVH